MASTLKDLPTSALQVLYDADRRGEEPTKLKKAQLKSSINAAFRLTSVKVLLESLTVEQLANLAVPLKLEESLPKGKDGKPKGNVKSGNVLRKRLTERLSEDGIAEFLEKNTELEVIQSIAERIDVETKGSKSALIEAIVSEVEDVGARLYLESFSEETLRDVAFEMKLLKDPAAAPRKTVLIESILDNTEVPKKQKAKKKEEVVVSKKKPKLAKGVNYHDVFQHYYHEELVAFAKDNGLKVSGTKKDLINRILAWFDGDKENTLAGQKRAPRRRKRSGSKKAAAPKKKEENGEGEAAKGKEEAGEEDGLDLDNLDKHSVAELKKYCEEEELKVEGTKKADFIRAITNYNNNAE